MTTTVQKQILIDARALIADPAHWGRGMLGSAADGGQVDPWDPRRLLGGAHWARFIAPPMILSVTDTKRHASETT
jgi:hypothetical protein